jgi:hypothetical protein
MTYMISRDGQEFGPYSLSDLQRYVATGDILPSDMARSEGMYEFLPVSQIIGTIPVPVTLSPISLTPAVEYPNPPNLHWGLVLLFGIITFGLFDAAWGIVLGIWMRKLLCRLCGLLVVCLFSQLHRSSRAHKKPSGWPDSARKLRHHPRRSL